MKLNPSKLKRSFPRPLVQRLLGWAPILVLVALMGCQQKAELAGNRNSAADLAGTYTLMSVDGKNVPCTLTHEGHTLTVKSGTFLINPDRTCQSKVVFSGPSGGESSREVKATYTREGATLTMRWEGAGMTRGTVEGDRFTMNNEGMIFAYKK